MEIDYLMAGDYVQLFETDSHRNKFYKVIAIDSESGNVTISDGNNDKLTISCDRLFPVPLNNKVMKRIGFERNGGSSSLTIGSITIRIFHWSDCSLELIIYGDDLTPIIKLKVMFVHEIQHLLKQVKVKDSIKL